MQRPHVLTFILSLAASVATPLLAQRASPAVYDAARTVRLEGAVTKIDWATPHTWVFVNAKDAAGAVVNWAVRVGSPEDLERSGWAPGTLRTGEVVVVEGSPATGTSRQVAARSVVLKAGNRRLFTAGAAPRAAAASAPAPRWPDGRVRLGAPAGQKGYWGAATARALTENSSTAVRMNEDGLLTNLADADRVAPFQPWARALYLYRQRTRLKDDPMARCYPPGGPRQFQIPGGFQFVEQPALGRILVLLGGGNRNWRVISTDGRPPEQAAEAVLSFYGTSVGRWEKDTLVVESSGYNERFWLTSGGLPHTEALRLVERFSRPNLGTLRYEVTVDDPRTYTRPWTGGWTVQWVPDAEMREAFCEDTPELAVVQ
jgi:hypothetical protein